MDSRLGRLARKLRLRYLHRNKLVFSPGARRRVSADDVYEVFDRNYCGHFASYDDRNDVEFWLVPDPESGVTTAMLPAEYRRS